ncbi:hypothetical protein RSAG8_12518, partial [Rhizoctonia solani AG-8 WAC10335]
MNRQDEFSFRLAQWLLDQIHSEEELKTVTQQFNVLFSQAQRELIEELYLHVGRLIFQKFTRTKTQYAQLCAQLCRSLFMANLKQRSDLSARPVPIHAHLFQCCLDYLSSSDAMQHSEAQRATRGTHRSGTSQPETCVSGAGPDSKEDRIVAISLLVLELCRCGLVSAVQVYEYTFQLTTLLSSGHSVNLLGTVYTLLDGYFSRLDTSLWKGEIELLQNWVKYLIPDAGADQDHQEGAQNWVKYLIPDAGADQDHQEGAQDDLQFRLAQWLLDQLNYHGEFETVAEQIGLLISQTPEQSIGELYAHIGKIIFQKMTQAQQGEFTLIRLCTQLCCSLLAVHFKQYPALSPRVALIHEHILRLCIDSMPAGIIIKSDSRKNNGIATGPVATDTSVASPDVPVGTICEILLQLHDFQLVSSVNLFEYMFRVFHQRKALVGPRLTSAVAGLRLLLNACFPHPYFGTWKNELDCFHKWVNEHTGSGTDGVNVILGNDSRTEESSIAVGAEDLTKEHTDTMPPAPIRPLALSNNPISNPGASSTNDNNPASNSAKALVSPNNFVSRSNKDDDEEANGTIGNNHGIPPHRVGMLDSTGDSAIISESVKSLPPVPPPRLTGLAQPTTTDAAPATEPALADTAPRSPEPRRPLISKLLAPFRTTKL